MKRDRIIAEEHARILDLYIRDDGPLPPHLEAIVKPVEAELPAAALLLRNMGRVCWNEAILCAVDAPTRFDKLPSNPPAEKKP